MAKPRRPPAKTRELPRVEVEATVAARKELGEEHEAQLIEGFLERMQDEIDARVDERLAERRPAQPRPRAGGTDWAGFLLAFLSLGIGIGATGAATGNDADWIAPIAWLAIVMVNLAYFFRR